MLLLGLSEESQLSLIMKISAFNSISFAFNKPILLQILLGFEKKTFKFFFELFDSILKNDYYLNLILN